MILSGVSLPNYSANPWTIAAHENKEIFNNEPIGRVLVDQFDVSKSLLIRTDLIRTFHDKNAFVPENTIGFLSGLKIKLQYCLMVFLS